MSTPTEVVAFYMQRIANASHPVEKRIIEGDLLLYYYRLSDDECNSVEKQMRTILDRHYQEALKIDPLIQRAEELLNRIKSRVPQS